MWCACASSVPFCASSPHAARHLGSSNLLPAPQSAGQSGLDRPSCTRLRRSQRSTGVSRPTGQRTQERTDGRMMRCKSMAGTSCPCAPRQRAGEGRLAFSRVALCGRWRACGARVERNGVSEWLQDPSEGACDQACDKTIPSAPLPACLPPFPAGRTWPWPSGRRMPQLRRSSSRGGPSRRTQAGAHHPAPPCPAKPTCRRAECSLLPAVLLPGAAGYMYRRKLWLNIEEAL